MYQSVSMWRRLLFVLSRSEDKRGEEIYFALHGGERASLAMHAVNLRCIGMSFTSSELPRLSHLSIHLFSCSLLRDSAVSLSLIFLSFSLLLSLFLSFLCCRPSVCV